MKLGGIEGAGAAPIAELPFVDVLAPLFEASRHRAACSFSYRGRARELEPWGLTSKFGHWYVVGFDRGADDMRVYRADRIEGDIDDGRAPARSRCPGDFRADTYLEDRPWDYGEGRATDVVVRVDPGYEVGFCQAVGPEAKVTHDARRRHARDDPRRRVPRRGQLRARLPRPRADPGTARRTRRGRRRARRLGEQIVSRTDAPPQLERVLAMIPWLATHRDVRKAEIAERFRISVDQLDADLALIMMVGVPPYSPGDYINVTYDGDTVDLWLAPYFTAPLQLTAAEGLALLAGGRTLLAVPGSDPDGPLATAIAKLERALGVSEVVVELASPPYLDAVRDAAAEGRRIEIEYWSSGRDALTTRRIDPGPPFFALGEWYTDAYCWLREGPRMFRIDRIRGVTPTDETFEPTRPIAGAAVYHPRPDDPRVTIELPAGRELGHRERAGGVGGGARRRPPAHRRPGERAGVARADPPPGGPAGRGGGPAGVAGRRARRRGPGPRPVRVGRSGRPPERTLSHPDRDLRTNALRCPVGRGARPRT